MTKSITDWMSSQELILQRSKWEKWEKNANEWWELWEWERGTDKYLPRVLIGSIE